MRYSECADCIFMISFRGQIHIKCPVGHCAFTFVYRSCCFLMVLSLVFKLQVVVFSLATHCITFVFGSSYIFGITFYWQCCHRLSVKVWLRHSWCASLLALICVAFGRGSLSWFELTRIPDTQYQFVSIQEIFNHCIHHCCFIFSVMPVYV